MYNDDIEIVNLLGIYIKKYKIMFFYVMFVNILFEYCLKLYVIFFIGVVWFWILKSYGILKLLENFIKIVNVMLFGGL